MARPLAPLLVLLTACGGDEGATRDAQGTRATDCSGTTSSNLAGVRIVFADQPCTYTLARAAAGIDIAYDVVIDAALASVVDRPQDIGGGGAPGASGLILFEELSGGGELYCICDMGLGAGLEPTLDLVAGSYRSVFHWTGRNWRGPSDTSSPMGAPFPPGSYTLRVSAVGAHAGAEYTVTATFPIRLVP